MSIISIDFLILAAALVIVYFIAPKKWQWIVLLLASVAFYYTLGWQAAAFVIGTATTVYLATVFFTAYDKKHPDTPKGKIPAPKIAVYWLTLAVNVGALCLFKYFPLPDGLIYPLGISFYTFQSIGYLTDAYHKKVAPEKNYFKVLLFTGFFPQMTQGPISDFKQLSVQLYAEHEFNYDRFARGCQRMLWGFIKKIMLAERLYPYVQAVFAHYNEMAGLTVAFGAAAYAIYLYADFSGYMDIVCGLCEILGIDLAENFRQPYFSHSVAEYWRRWHMTLGEWFKKYIYYPAATCRLNQWIGKKLRPVGRKFSGNTVATIALMITWAATGVWHGDTAGYIVWGLLNGAFLILSVWLEGTYKKAKNLLHIKDDAWYWRGFTLIRTFIIVALIKVLPEVGTLSDGLGLWARIFTFSAPSGLSEILAANYGVTIPLTTWAVFAVFFIFSLISLKTDVRDLFNKIPMPLRVIILAAAFVLLVAVGIPEGEITGGFAYAKF